MFAKVINLGQRLMALLATLGSVFRHRKWAPSPCDTVYHMGAASGGVAFAKHEPRLWEAITASTFLRLLERLNKRPEIKRPCR